MKQRIKRILACMLAIVAAFTAVFSNVTPAMAVSAEAALSYWDASAKDVGEVSEIKPDFYHGKILYGLIDGHSAYCMNFGLQAYMMFLKKYTEGMLISRLIDGAFRI